MSDQERIAAISELLFTGFYDPDDDAREPWTDFGEMCGIAERLEVMLRRAKALSDADLLPDTGSDVELWLRLVWDTNALEEWLDGDPAVRKVLASATGDSGAVPNPVPSVPGPVREGE